MVLGRTGGGILAHARFSDLPRWLRPRSLLVVNDTRVVRARLVGSKPTGGRLEILLVRREDGAPGAEHGGAADWVETWEVLARDLASLGPGARVSFGADLDAEVLERGALGRARLRFSGRAGRNLVALAEEIGSVPLPHYIEAARRRAVGADAGRQTGQDDAAIDRERYQTVYAEAPGAVAAPTAGLHFTPRLLAALEAGGHEIARLTLHVGPGTFRPVKADDPRDHRLDAEAYVVPAATAGAVARASADGRAVVAVGTTVVRALETAAAGGAVTGGAGLTDLFVLPGATFRVVTDLVTNFHLPRSSLLMLVAAFAGRESVMAAYAEAIRLDYRFYSYGDAMLIRSAPAALRAP